MSGLPTPAKATGLKTPSKIGKAAPAPALPQPNFGSRPQSPEVERAKTPVDDFVIGDRVLVGGTKPGSIAFLGETQFAAGQWSGVVLDDPVGKNDGSVQSIRYFQCEHEHGVFARTTKLSHHPGTVGAAARVPATPRVIPPTPVMQAPETHRVSTPPTPLRNGTVTPPTGAHAHGKESPVGFIPTVPHMTPSRGSSGSSTSLHKTSSNTSNTQSPPVRHIKIGDRVVVSGSKFGTLRFLGQTDFAVGNWAGIELDEPSGKNDGAVAGKRYFQGKPLHGLFAPVHKVTKVNHTSTAPALPSTPSAGNMMTPRRIAGMPGVMSSSLRMARERSGSQDSLSSISSTASSVSRPRVRLGITSLGPTKAKGSQRPGSAATSAALTKALKEKEEHIEQLLRERDLERSEVARNAAQVDESDSKLVNMRMEFERYRDETEASIVRLQDIVSEFETQKADLHQQLEDQKRKVEDLQFQIEEDAIINEEQPSRPGEEGEKVTSLQNELKEEKMKNIKMENELDNIKSLMEQEKSGVNSTQATYLDEIEDLKHKLSQAENKVNLYEFAKEEDATKSNQTSSQLSEKLTTISELESTLDSKTLKMKQLEARLTELDESVTSGQEKRDKMQNNIEELTANLSLKDTAASSMSNEAHTLNTTIADLQRKLEASNLKNAQLAADKTSLEEQISEVMRNSGDSSQQLSMLNEQVREKDRIVVETQTALSECSQALGRAQDNIEHITTQHKEDLDSVHSKHSDEIQNVQALLAELQAEHDKAKIKTDKLTEEHKLEIKDLIDRKDGEIGDIRNEIKTQHAHITELETMNETHKQNIEKMRVDNENIQFEKEKCEKNLSRVEDERETLLFQLDEVRSGQTSDGDEREELLERLRSLQAEKEQAEHDRILSETNHSALLSERMSLSETHDKLQDEIEAMKSHLEAELSRAESLEQEMVRIQEDAVNSQQMVLDERQKHQQEAADIQNQLTETRSLLASVEAAHKHVETERDSLKTELSLAQSSNADRQVLEEENANLSQEFGVAKKRISELEELVSKQKTLKLELSASKAQHKVLEAELQSHKLDVSNLQNENATLQTYKSSNETMKVQISRLEKSLAEHEENANIFKNIDTEGDPVLARLKYEKEEAVEQQNFLNSVIVDLQGKNSELKLRLEAMESGNVMNGAMDISEPRVRAPRLFCDICDEFDKHDTDDCPLQAMSDSPPPTISHAPRGVERPYCDMCEVFGHSSEECDVCDDQETF